RDDLQRHFDARRLVPGEPDGPGAAAAERLQGPVAPQHEFVRGYCYGRFGHGRFVLRSRAKALPTGQAVTVTRDFPLHGAMTERDADIEFDFFEEPETREAARPERPPQRGGP